MKKKIIILIIITSSLFILSSCGKQEIDNLALATAVGIDLDDEESLIVTIQVLNTNAFGNNSKDVTPVLVYTEKGRTIQEVFRRFTSILTEKLFFYQFEVLVIGQKLAERGIEPYINFFAINQETLHGYAIVITHNCTAEDVLKTLSGQEIVPASAIRKVVNSAQKYYGLSKLYYTDETISDIKSEGIDLSLASIDNFGKPKETETVDKDKMTNPDNYNKIGTIGIFKEDKLVAFLSEKQSIAYNYINNRIKNTVLVVVKADGNMVTLEISRVKTKIKYIKSGDKPSFKVNISFEAVVVSDNSGETSQELDYALDLEARANYEVKAMCEDLINYSKIYKSDIIGFGRDIYRFDFKKWQEIRDIYYDEIYPNLEVEFITNCKISNVKP